MKIGKEEIKLFICKGNDYVEKHRESTKQLL